MSLSLTPLIGPIGWDGYAPGTFVYQDHSYYMRYSDETIGNDKPHIFLVSGWPVRRLIDLVEVSDHDSYADGLNLYRNMSSRGRLIDGGLTITYNTMKDFIITKSISIVDDGVEIEYRADKPVKLNISLWRWYYAEIEGLIHRGVSSPVEVEPKKKIEFTFMDEGKKYVAKVEFSCEPTKVTLWKDLTGFNKIVTEFQSSSLNLVLSLQRVGNPNFNFFTKDLIYFLISGAMGLIYLGIRYYGAMVKVRLNRPRH